MKLETKAFNKYYQINSKKYKALVICHDQMDLCKDDIEKSANATRHINKSEKKIHIPVETSEYFIIFLIKNSGYIKNEGQLQSSRAFTSNPRLASYWLEKG